MLYKKALAISTLILLVFIFLFSFFLYNLKEEEKEIARLLPNQSSQEISSLHHKNQLIIFSIASLTLGLLFLLLYIIQIARKDYYKKLLELEKAELKIKEEFEKLFQNLPIGLYISSADGKILKTNKAFLDILGYQNYDDLKNISITTQVYKLPEMRARFKELVQKQGFVKGFESEIKRKDGSVIYVKESAFCNFDEKGEALSFWGAIEDITEQKEKDLKLRQSEELYQQIFNNLTETVFLSDNEGKILKVNDAFEKLFNKNEEEAIGKPCYEVCHDSSKFVEGCPFAKAINTRKRETTFMNIGEKSFLATVDPIFNEDSNLAEAVHVLTDITEINNAHKEREKLKEQIALMQKIEAIGRLAGGVAHDFNNVLSVILGNLELIFSEIDLKDPIRENLLEIQKAALKSAELTKQLLGFARKQTYSPKVLNINKHLKGMKAVLKRFIGENIDIILELEDNLRPVKLDPSQLDQVVMNLVINSRDAIGEGKQGAILIETKNVTIEKDYLKTHSYAKEGEFAMLVVSDNGCGISEENLTRIFEPFFTTKESGKGTGLGLSTVYGIVHQNNGFINAYSEANSFTTMKVYFPASLEKEEEEEESIKPKPNIHPIKIMLVEDEESINKMVALMLKRSGHKVFAFSSSARALEFASQSKEKFDLLITDVIMPEMNGKDLYENLKKILPDLKVLYMSGYTSNVIAHNHILDKNIHFIEKPFTSLSLLKKIEEIK